MLKFASFDILPTHHVLTHISREWALNSYHWFFMAQPYDIPEKLIEGKEDYYIVKKLTKMGIGNGGFSEETLKEYARCRAAIIRRSRRLRRRIPSSTAFSSPKSKLAADERR